MGLVMKIYKNILFLTLFSSGLVWTSCGTESRRDLRTRYAEDTAVNPGGNDDAGGISFPGGANPIGKPDPDPTDPDSKEIPNSKLNWDGVANLEPISYEIIAVE